jgi:hypothetical protein
MLDVPATLYEFHGEPVKELGMRWRFALSTELFARAHQPNAEDGFPKDDWP